jgi:hypothetical protein
MKTKRNIIISLIIAALFLFGCAANQISYYDNETYKGLTYLKIHIVNVYNTYNQVNLSNTGVNYVLLRLGQMKEYEKWKKDNNPTYKQIEIIQKMFVRHLKERLSYNKPWEQSYIDNKLKNMLEAVDLAIESELLKNKEN